MGRADEFLDAYADLERHFRKRLEAENIKSFSVMIKELSKRDRVVARFRDELFQWHDLRNAIVHERPGGGTVIAEPVPKALAAFIKLTQLLTAPPKLSTRFQQEVARVAPGDSIAKATKIMRDSGFSQLPVYDDGGLHGLLTATAVTRWLASAFDGGVSADTPVSQVLDDAEDQADWRLLARNATFTDAVSLFDEAHEKGHELAVILITHDGKPNQKPIGILTVSDLPALIDIY